MLRIIPYIDRSAALDHIFGRRAAFDTGVDDAVRHIIVDVRRRGRDAVLELTERFDGCRPDPMRVPEDVLAQALANLDSELRGVIERAADNIRRFHERQLRQSWFVEDGDGVILGQRVVPIETVGLYVPGGTAAYPSSVLMNAIPALVAGVERIVMVSPPGPDGAPSTEVLATAHFLGLTEVYAVGGAQAVAALAYGAGEIPRVDKIVGPGNAYVAAAKKQVYGTVDIDSVAGPSEIVVLADESANPTFVAADLLSQAEHDVRASAVLVTTSENLAREVAPEVERMAASLPRRQIIEDSLRDYGAAIVCSSLSEAIDCVNELAPEHLEIMTEHPWDVLPRIRHAGAIFLGPHSSEPVGDYFAGPNHVLPTGGTARYASALSVDSFLRHQSIVSYSEQRLKQTADDIIRFAESEGLDAHALAIRVRRDERRI